MNDNYTYLGNLFIEDEKLNIQKISIFKNENIYAYLIDGIFKQIEANDLINLILKDKNKNINKYFKDLFKEKNENIGSINKYDLSRIYSFIHNIYKYKNNKIYIKYSPTIETYHNIGRNLRICNIFCVTFGENTKNIELAGYTISGNCGNLLELAKIYTDNINNDVYNFIEIISKTIKVEYAIESINIYECSICNDIIQCKKPITNKILCFECKKKIDRVNKENFNTLNNNVIRFKKYGNELNINTADFYFGDNMDIKGSCTYFIHDKKNNYIKIGKTNKIKTRFSQIKTSNPNDITVIFILKNDYEEQLHKYFAKDRQNGEWFKAENILKFINRLT